MWTMYGSLKLGFHYVGSLERKQPISALIYAVAQKL